MDLFNVYPLSRVDTNSLYRGRFYGWACRLCSLYLTICYIEVLFHTFYCNFGWDIEYRLLVYTKTVDSVKRAR